MAEKVEEKKDVVEDVVTEDANEETVETPETKTKTKFTPEVQAEINRQRAEEKRTWKKANTELQEQLTDAQTKLEEMQDEILSVKIEGLNLDDKTKKLLKRLSYEDAIDYLAEVSEADKVVSKKVTPKTPESKKVEDNNQPVKPIVRMRI
jgi:TolA-binding protein